MFDLNERGRDLREWSQQMKRDWDERARQDAKWFINTGRLQQSDAEFDATGEREVERLILADLDLLTQGRDPGSLRLLEVGCGLGRLTRPLARIFGEVCATDVSAEMLRQARARLAGVGNVTFHETDGLDFAPLPSEHFDVVFSAYVFRHVPSAEVIYLNLCDAFRVLKPGGALKFQANTLTTFDYGEVEKDTWVGASFPEAAIRRFAQEKGAQLISICGGGSPDCWATLRKRPQVASAQPQYAVARPRIEDFARADSPQVKEVPRSGPGAALALLVSGLIPDEVDANTVAVEIKEVEAWPRYVGPPRRGFDASGEAWTQVEINIPVGMPAGEACVRVRLGPDEASPPVTVALHEPRPVVPRIERVSNANDEGLLLLVEGLDETADTGNVRLQVGDRIIKPSAVGSSPRPGVYQVSAHLPRDLRPGATELRLFFGNIGSPGAPLEIK
ncbi:MAG TPA: class I SAM-dependent methyltransferase [Blastocatellia bacterium]|nr:class I SAM-dependent methyltransferase [Blastocatellia bacterium]